MKHHNFKGLGFQLRGVDACDRLFAPIFAARSRELFLVALLDENCEIIELLTASGSEHEVEVDAAQIFKEALNGQAKGIILAHNHPSGDERPSRSDKVLTRSLAVAAEAVDLCIMDHLIYGDQKLFSFRQNNLL